MFTMSVRRRMLAATAATILLAIVAAGPPAHAASAAEIDAKVNAALRRLKTEAPGANAVLAQAKGVLVFAEVIKAGFVFGGEGGEGALRIGGKAVAHYNIVSASVGLQAGAVKRDIIIAFLDTAELKKFRDSQGWKVGADGSVTLIDVGAGKTVDLAKLKAPIVGFTVGQKGLMAGISLDGSKISKIEPK